jgi:transposase-like protein
MEKNILEEMIERGLSTYQIAKEIEKSQTSVRHWLRKYGMNTKHVLFKDDHNVNGEFVNGRECKFCSKILTGKKHSYCSDKCKSSFYYKTHKSEVNPNTNLRQKRISKERKLQLIEMSGGACSKCGYKKNYAALTFHHLDPTNKTFTVDSRKLSNTNWNSILEEWKKCELLCANCHFELHNPNCIIS